MQSLRPGKIQPTVGTPHKICQKSKSLKSWKKFQNFGFFLPERHKCRLWSALADHKGNGLNKRRRLIKGGEFLICEKILVLDRPTSYKLHQHRHN